MLVQLSWYLLAAFCAVALACLVTVGVYYFRTRRTTSKQFDDPDLVLRYFLQEQVDYDGSVVGYECLLRQQLPDKTWKLPRGIDAMPLQKVIVLLEDTFKHLPKTKIHLSINLSHEQVVSRDFDYFVRWAISKIDPMSLTVEYRPKRRLRGLAAHKFKKNLKRVHSYGMLLAIDNVDAELSTLKRVEWLLDQVDILKCSMTSFRKDDPSIWLDLNLQFWNRLAQEHGIDLYLVGIENEEDAQLANQLKIQFRQGYLFGKPVDRVEGADS